MEITRTEIEQLLAAMRPARLQADVIDRMERAVNGDISLTAMQSQTETQLGDLKPMSLPSQLETRLLKIVESEPFRVNDKVVMFPAAKEKAAPAKKSRKWGAAAAVAVAGGLVALMIPHSPPADFVQNNPKYVSDHHYPYATNAGNIVTTSYGSELERAEDSGVIWDKSSGPKRVLRVHYQDRVLVRDAAGVERMLFLPREEFIVFPEKID